jgi:parallel beta-helix repeat protein
MTHSLTLRSRIGISASALLTAVCGAGLVAPAASAATPAGTGPVAPAPAVSSEQSAEESAAVAAETRRLIEIRAVNSNMAMHGTSNQSPYRLATGSGYTLVLPARTAPYTVSDLLQLAPQTFLRLTDGSYLLLENIYVGMGATLNLNSPSGITLRMASSVSGFVTIVSFDGQVNLAGSAKHPMTITSWNPQTDTPDTDPSNGRAYIRVIGGKFTMSHVDVDDLGFWSGATGGISLTGSDRPATGATSGGSTFVHVHATHVHGKSHKSKGTTTGSDSSTDSGTDVAQPQNGTSATGVATLPTGALNTPGSEYSVSGLSYVSAKITDSVVSGNAYGIFISSADGIEISNTQVTGSLIAGVVLHRFATNAVIDDVTADANHGDGFDIARAAHDVELTDCTATDNAGNGFTVNGQPLSNGPSPSGEPVGSYGNNTVAASTAQDNGHYGIEVLGGLSIALDRNDIIGNTMGIVVRRGAQKVSVVGNKLSAQLREGISIRDGVTGSTVADNTVQGAVTGIYVRASTANITGNTVVGAQEHGITLDGAVGGTQVSDNTLSGAGPSPISTSRERGAVAVGHNSTSAWDNTTPMWTRVRRMARPMTLIWIGVFLLIALAGLKGRSTRARNRKKQAAGGETVFVGRHPYFNQLPLPSRPAAELSPTLGLLDERTMEIAI